MRIAQCGSLRQAVGRGIVGGSIKSKSREGAGIRPQGLRFVKIASRRRLGRKKKGGAKAHRVRCRAEKRR